MVKKKKERTDKIEKQNHDKGKKLIRKLENALKWPLIAGFGAILLALVPVLYQEHCGRNEQPAFDITDSIINPEQTIFIEALNDAAKKKKY